MPNCTTIYQHCPDHQVSASFFTIQFFCQLEGKMSEEKESRIQVESEDVKAKSSKRPVLRLPRISCTETLIYFLCNFMSVVGLLAITSYFIFKIVQYSREP